MLLTINSRTYTIPDTWNDMNLRQALECYNILMSGTGRIFQPQEVVPAKRIGLVTRLCGLTDSQMLQWQKDNHQVYGTEDGQLVFLSELSAILTVTNPFFDITEGPDGQQLFAVKLGLTRCPWPQLQYTSPKGKKKYYYAPADALDNITLYEMALTFAIFERYLKSNDPADAHELIATLYRPSKPATRPNRLSGYEGDRRLPIYKHESMVRKRIPRIAQLPQATQRLIIFWFASCRQHIIDSFPNIFRTEGDGALERVGNDYGWGGMLLALAGGIIHLEQVSLEPYQNGLVYLSYLEDERIIRERKMRSKA